MSDYKTERKGKIQTIATFVANLTESGPVKLTRLQIVYKVSVLLFCSVGFVYQVWAFMDIYLKYPSTVDFDIVYPDYIETPAFSVCNENAFRRTVYCQYNPDKCRMTERGEEVCENDPILCKNLTFMSYYMVPDMTSLEDEIRLASLDDLMRYGHTPRRLLRECKASWMPGANLCEEKDLVRFISVSIYEIYFICYMINSRESRKSTKLSYFPVNSASPTPPEIEFIFDSESVEYFQPRRPVRILLTIQNPFEMINPFVYGYSLETGMEYNFRLTPKISYRLPAPFSTKCKDYDDDVMEEGEIKPKSQQMCSNYCMLEAARKACNCFTVYQITPARLLKDNETFCLRNVEPTACVNNIDSQPCFKNCAKSCKYLSYDVTYTKRILEENYPPLRYIDPEFGPHNIGRDLEEEKTYFLTKTFRFGFYTNLFLNNSVSKVKIQLKKPELTRYQQTSKFESIQLFCYIGGYLGMWLGFSLLEIHILFNVLGGYFEDKFLRSRMNHPKPMGSTF